MDLMLQLLYGQTEVERLIQCLKAKFLKLRQLRASNSDRRL